MTEIEENRTVNNGFVNSKFGKVVLIIVSVLLVFVGPTYVIYGLAEVIKLDLAASTVVGAILFIIGLLMMRYLVQKKIIT